ncbi:MAG: response regulator [Nitrospirota bacterium]|nr:response regulator [Nitrospirota bacterium]
MNRQNARKAERFVIRVEVLINNAIMGHALDISETGMFVHSHIMCQAGKTVSTQFSLEEGDPPLTVTAEVRHARSGVGMGMRFVNLLPDEIARIRQFIEKRGHAPSDERVKILIVNGSPFDRTMFRSNIVLLGHEVREAGDGAEALQSIQNDLPTLVLLDPFVKVMDGFELLKALRADEKTKDLKVVILTGGAVTPDLYQKVSPYHVLDIVSKLTTPPKKLAEKISGYLAH